MIIILKEDIMLWLKTRKPKAKNELIAIIHLIRADKDKKAD